MYKDCNVKFTALANFGIFLTASIIIKINTKKILGIKTCKKLKHFNFSHYFFKHCILYFLAVIYFEYNCV